MAPRKSSPKKISKVVDPNTPSPVSKQIPENVVEVPVVDDTKTESKDLKESQSDDSTKEGKCELEDKFKKIIIDISQNIIVQKNVLKTVKALEKDFNKLQKSNKKSKRNTDPDKKRKPSGFTIPAPISKELADFLGVEAGTSMSRTEATKAINKYVRENELRTSADKRIFIIDDKLRPIIDTELLGNDSDGKPIPPSYFNLQKCIKGHFQKKTPPTIRL
jgi:chromatin remodeling complex protein RSC6